MRVLIKTSDAIQHFKNASRLAEDWYHPQAINQWGEYIPDHFRWEDHGCYSRYPLQDYQDTHENTINRLTNYHSVNVLKKR